MPITNPDVYTKHNNPLSTPSYTLQPSAFNTSHCRKIVGTSEAVGILGRSRQEPVNWKLVGEPVTVRNLIGTPPEITRLRQSSPEPPGVRDGTPSFLVSVNHSCSFFWISQFFTRALLQEFSYATNVSILVLSPFLLLPLLGCNMFTY
ncbi:hypothetical protein HanIR_Chr06g0276971 [Helianthus annuus]|nr:hypothetical protein HanIR_Chr06g0276971 [Helianthus annuus]